MHLLSFYMSLFLELHFAYVNSNLVCFLYEFVYLCLLYFLLYSDSWISAVAQISLSLSAEFVISVFPYCKFDNLQIQKKVCCIFHTNISKLSVHNKGDVALLFE